MKKLHLDFGWSRWFIMVLAAVFVALWSAPAFSAEQAVARLTGFSGKVLIKSQGSWGIEPEQGLPFYSGDKLVTKIGSATITFNDGAVMEIKPNSNLLIRETEEDEKSLGQEVKTVKRKLRLLLGKMLFKSGKGSKTETTLETTTMVCGLQGTAGTLSIGADGQTYLQFTEGSGSTVGDFISGVAEDVPPELANLNPAQRAAFVAAAAAEQAKQAAERAASGEISEANAALAGAQAAEAAAREARAAAEAMLNNPDPDIQAQAAQAIAAADEAIAAAQAAQQDAIDAGATAGSEPEPYEPPEGEEGFEVTYFEVPQGVESDIPPEPWEADTTLPVIGITSGPDALTNLAAALFELGADESVTFAYSTDGGETWTDFDIGTEGVLDLRGIPEGANDIMFRATDGSGNTGDEIVFNWTTDYTAPVSTIPTGPAAIANTSAFGFDATDANKVAGITYEYSLDNGASWTSTGANLDLGLAVDGSVDGDYTLDVRATDAAGNVSAASSYTWTHDTIAPVIALSAAPADGGGTDIKPYHINDEPSDDIAYSYDGPYEGLSDNTYTLTVTAEDEAGNISEPKEFTFTLSSFPLTGTENVFGIGSVIKGNTNGTVVSVEGDDWGYWTNEMGGTYTGDHGGSFEMIAGDTDPCERYAWLSRISWDGETDTGISFFKSLSLTSKAEGSGSLSEVQFKSDGTWSAKEDGSGLVDTRLDFGGYRSPQASLYYCYDYGEYGRFKTAGYANGNIGLTQMENGDFDLLAIGEYNDSGSSGGHGGPYVRNSDVSGAQVIDGVQAGYGGFTGYTGGVWNKADPDDNSGYMEGYAAALYRKENGTAGLLFGATNGNFYDLNEGGYGGIWTATGTLKSVEILTELDPESTAISTGLYFYGYGGYGKSGGCNGGFNAEGTSGGINVNDRNDGHAKFIDGQDWGVWKSMLGGKYDAPLDTTDTTWYLPLESSGGINSWAGFAGKKWSDGKVEADMAGAWVCIKHAFTGVMGGGLKGTFDPNNTTWQAMSIGTFIETGDFLDMVDGQIEIPQGLNIPAVQVGITNLTQEAGTTINRLENVYMNGVRFFAYSQGNPPRIWATSGVGGDFVDSPSTSGPSVDLSDGSINSTFTINRWDSNKWSADISGSGTLTRTDVTGTVDVNMKGGAAGTYPDGTSGSFKGTGAGVAR